MGKLHIAHLSAGYMLTSLVGIVISFFYVFSQSRTWGFTLGLFFTIMLISSLISMHYEPVELKEKEN